MNSSKLKNSLLVSFFLGTLLASCSTPETARSQRDPLNGSQKKLQIEKYVGSEAGFLVTSNLILGEQEALLVDAQFTRSDAKQVVEMIKKSGRTLKTVFITHGHPDHYFGSEVLKAAFPNARIVASRDTIEDIKATGQGKLDYWKKMFGNDLTDSVPVVSQLEANDLTIDGEQFELKALAPGESEHASVLVVPSLKAAFVGDLAYDDVHLWLAEATHSTQTWKENLDKIFNDALIQDIYVGHQKKSRINTKAVLTSNIKYIDAAVSIFKKSKSSEEASAALKEKYPTYALPIIADLAAAAFIPKSAKQ